MEAWQKQIVLQIVTCLHDRSRQKRKSTTTYFCFGESKPPQHLLPHEQTHVKQWRVKVINATPTILLALDRNVATPSAAACLSRHDNVFAVITKLMRSMRPMGLWFDEADKLMRLMMLRLPRLMNLTKPKPMWPTRPMRLTRLMSIKPMMPLWWLLGFIQLWYVHGQTIS